MRVVYARRTIVCWVAPLDVRFSPNGTALGSHGRQPMVTGPPPRTKPQRGDMIQIFSRPFWAQDI